ncbi:zf-CCHC domain-containing protein [Tanacetum coccineum]
MDSDKYLEGQSMQRPPLFETYAKAKDLDLWHIILNGDFSPVSKNEVTQNLEVVPFEEQSDDLKKKLAKNNEAKMVIYNALPKKEYERIFMCKTAKDIWKSLLITHQEESIDSGFARLNTIITSLKALDEESKDLSSLALDELIGNLKVHEVVMEKDSKFYRGKKERIKSIALKAKKESSDDETSTSKSNDEEYVIAVRNFKKFFRRKGKFVRQPRKEKKSFRQRDEKKGKSDRKCFRCGDPNHLIGNCPKPSPTKIKGLHWRYTWTRFLKTKNEAFEKFEILGRKIQNQLGSSIIAIRMNHGPEFDNEVQFEAYCDAQGITHNFSALHEDVGEEEAIRKNTKIVNTNNEEDKSIEVDEIIVDPNLRSIP